MFHFFKKKLKILPNIETQNKKKEKKGHAFKSLKFIVVNVLALYAEHPEFDPGLSLRYILLHTLMKTAMNMTKAMPIRRTAHQNSVTH